MESRTDNTTTMIRQLLGESTTDLILIIAITVVIYMIVQLGIGLIEFRTGNPKCWTRLKRVVWIMAGILFLGLAMELVTYLRGI